jgi:hypothetical protein
MAHKDEYLPFTIHLNDLAYYNSRFVPAPGAEVDPNPPNDMVFRSPADAAAVYGAALATAGKWAGGPLPIQFDPRDLFLSPCIRSTWFGSTMSSTDPFPLDQQNFTRKSGGWFGISWLFGDKTTYHWIGRFEYSPGLDGGVTSTVVKMPMPARRWIDGAEIPTAGEGQSGGNARAARRASRHTQGLGYSFDSTLATRSHNHLENGAAASKSAWERLYVRFVRFPDVPIVVWKANNTITAGGPMLTITAAGALTLNDYDGVSTATPIGGLGANLLVNKWYKVDLVYSFGTVGPALPYFKAYINGLKVIDAPPASLVNMQGGTKNVSISTIGGGTPAGGANNGIWHLDDWVCAEVPDVAYETGSSNDFIRGSRIALIGAQGFASDHNVLWLGDWRLARMRPITAGIPSQFTSSSSGALLALATDAEVEIDGQANQFGIIALNVALFSDKGGAGASGTIGWKFPTGGNDLAAIVQTAGSFSWTNRLYRPAGLIDPVTPLAGLELKHAKGASVDPAKVQSLIACAEIVGVFGDEDVYPQSALGTAIADPVAGGIQGHVGIHNAPYPHTPWAKDRSTAPQSAVVIKTGQYVGNGTGQDLKFRTPVAFLWIRPETGGSGGIQWFSSMNAAHVHGQRAFAPDTIAEALIDPTFVVGGATETNMDLPAAPDNLEEAINLSNQLAFGFAKNDINYIGWAPYLTDPVYFFGRMLGSGSQGGPDEAVAGLYAVPPSPWLSTQMQQTLIRLGPNADVNAAGVTYDYVAFCDPGMRFSNAGALAATAFNGDILSPLDIENFTPESVLLIAEQDGASSTQVLMFKGLGSAASAISVLTLAEIASGLAVANGTMTHKAGLLQVSGNQNPYIAFRRDDHTTDPNKNSVVVLATWVGDGGAAKNIPLTPTGKRPMWALVVGHNGNAATRDPFHTGTNSLRFPNTNSTTDITAGAVDQLTVGVNLNTNGVTFDALIFMGCGAAGNNGWAAAGECIPVDPQSPPDLPPGWDPPPEPPTGPPVDPPFTPGPGGKPFGAQCIGPSTELINQALSRIGVSKQIESILDEPSDEAVTCRLHYESDIDATLRDFPWPFATHYATLTLVAGPTPVASPDWTYAYRQPSDCVFERRICLPRGDAVDPTPPPFQLSNEPAVVTTPPPIPIVGNTAANPTVFHTGPAHGLVSGQIVTIAGVVGSVPDVNGLWVVTVTDPTHFTIPLTCSNPGLGGTVTGPEVVVTPGFNLIYTNQAGAVLEYTCRPECVSLLGDALFREALIWKHASSIAPALSRMTDAAVNATKMYIAAIDRASDVLRPGNPGRLSLATATIDTAAAAIAANLNVANRALLRVGCQTITSLIGDQSREATAVRAIFEEELQGVLRDFPWAFATVYLIPALVAGTAQAGVNDDWLFSYRIPTDCVMVRRVINPALGRRYDPNPPTFREGTDTLGKLLFTNQENATIEATARYDAIVSRGDALFRDAFAWRLAACLAPSLSNPDPEKPEQLGRGTDDLASRQRATPKGSKQQLRRMVAQDAWRMYFMVINQATIADANEQQQEPEGQADWIMGRE